MTAEHSAEQKADHRLYIARAEFTAQMKPEGSPLNCHSAEQAEGVYHRIASGEIYVTNGTTHYCLNCAMEHHIVTPSRPSLEQGARVALSSGGSGSIYLMDE